MQSTITLNTGLNTTSGIILLRKWGGVQDRDQFLATTACMDIKIDL